MAFYMCRSMKSVIISNSVTLIDSCAFMDCYGLTSVTIGNSVKTIGNSTFSDCSSLTSITFPDSVKIIGSHAFYKCQRLTDVYCLAKNVPDTDTKAFIDSNINNVTLHVPSASVDDYIVVAPWKIFKNIVALTE